MKVLSMQDAVKEIRGKNKERNRFNKKKFDLLLASIINDPDYTAEIARIKRGEVDIKEISPTIEFRNWCRKLLEKAGMDLHESKKVLNKDFIIDNVDGLYDLFASAIYTYIDDCNSEFDLIPKKDFKGGIYLKDIPEKEKVGPSYSPKDRSFLGNFKEVKKAHKELGVKSSCPKYLRNRTPV